MCDNIFKPPCDSVLRQIQSVLVSDVFSLEQLGQQAQRFMQTPNAYRSVLILMASLALAYWLSNFLARGIVRLAQTVARRSDETSNETKQIRLRQVETYLSVAIAVVRAAVVAVVGYVVWDYLSPASNSSVAAIGASAFFIVFAGQTLGIVLRDVTSGAIMIIEKWFNVGDFIRVEPFLDVSGVVERMTLRSTKLRSLNGEVIWLHNQQIQAVKVTPHGVRRLAVDIFANNERVARTIIGKAIEAMPIGTLKVIDTPQIVTIEQWSDKLWHFVVVAETAPGREWLIDKYFVESLDELDEHRRGPQTFVRPHIARFADERAELSFKRAVRSKQATRDL